MRGDLHFGRIQVGCKTMCAHNNQACWRVRRTIIWGAVRGQNTLRLCCKRAFGLQETTLFRCRTRCWLKQKLTVAKSRGLKSFEMPFKTGTCEFVPCWI